MANFSWIFKLGWIKASIIELTMMLPFTTCNQARQQALIPLTTSSEQFDLSTLNFFKIYLRQIVYTASGIPEGETWLIRCKYVPILFSFIF